MTKPSKQQPTPPAGLQTYPRGMVPRLVIEMRLACISEMREAVQAISMEGGGPEQHAGVRWAQARMLHTLDQMEAAVP